MIGLNCKEFENIRASMKGANNLETEKRIKRNSRDEGNKKGDKLDQSEKDTTHKRTKKPGASSTSGQKKTKRCRFVTEEYQIGTLGQDQINGEDGRYSTI